MKKIYFVIGQFAFFLGILGFLANYLFLNNDWVVALISAVLLVLSAIINIIYLVRRK